MYFLPYNYELYLNFVIVTEYIYIYVNMSCIPTSQCWYTSIDIS